MTDFRTVASELVDAIKGIDPSTLDTRHIRGGFTHDEKIGAVDYVGGDRRFNLLGIGGFAGMQHNSRVTTDVDLLVDYVAATGHSSTEVDAAIHGDFAKLVKTLQAPANWPATCVIRPAGDTRWPYSIETVEGEDSRPVRRLVVSFSVEYTALD